MSKFEVGEIAYYYYDLTCPVNKVRVGVKRNDYYKIQWLNDNNKSVGSSCGIANHLFKNIEECLAYAESVYVASENEMLENKLEELESQLAEYKNTGFTPAQTLQMCKQVKVLQEYNKLLRELLISISDDLKINGVCGVCLHSGNCPAQSPQDCHLLFKYKYIDELENLGVEVQP